MSASVGRKRRANQVAGTIVFCRRQHESSKTRENVDERRAGMDGGDDAHPRGWRWVIRDADADAGDVITASVH